MYFSIMRGFTNSQDDGQPGSGESGRDPGGVKVPPTTSVSHAGPSKSPGPLAERAESSTSLVLHSPPQSRPPPTTVSKPLGPLAERAESSTSLVPHSTTTKWEILDKTAQDGLGKSVAAAQTAWFIVQYLERWGAGQPKTQLEVMTLAYVVINAVIYVLWVGKPRDIREPIDARGRMISPLIPQETQLEDWSSVVLDGPVDGVKSWASLTVLPVVGVLFGGIHCFALWTPFPTECEAVLWKVSALYCTVLSLFIAVGYPPPESLNKKKKVDDDVDDIVGKYLAYLFGVGYSICRFILIVLAFTSLRALSPGMYETTNWVSLFPHVR